MRAMALQSPGEKLTLIEAPTPIPNPIQVQIKISVCGVCRTDLHVVDGELKNISTPLIPGHQIVGVVSACGSAVTKFKIGDRVGATWLNHTCGKCYYCMQQQENLCDKPLYTGYTVNGGFAEYCVMDQDFCFVLPDNYSDLQVAPLLCAGLVGFRAYNKVQNEHRIGIYGFGAAGHILIQVAKFQGKEVYVFTRANDTAAQNLARSLKADWIGDSSQMPPESLDAALIFAPIGDLIPASLKAVRKGGKVVCGGIHMSIIPAFSYDLLWGEREICSVANLTRAEARDFLQLAPQVPVNTTVTEYKLVQANQALDDLRSGKLSGAAVIVCNQ